RGLYNADELGGLPIAKFCEAVTAEGCPTSPGANFALHKHAAFHDADIYGDGKPTMVANGTRDVRQGAGALPVSEAIATRAFGIPWFKHYDESVIEQYAAAYRKVASQA